MDLLDILIPENGEIFNKFNIPTANLSEEVVRNFPKIPGVYYGWAQIDGTDVYKIIISTEKKQEQDKETTELHILEDDFKTELCGKKLKVIIIDRMRGALLPIPNDNVLRQIFLDDVDYAKNILETPQCQMLRDHVFFQKKST